MISEKLYLSYAENRAFLEGKRKRPFAPKPFGCMGWGVSVAFVLALLLAGVAIFEINFSNLLEKTDLQQRGIEYEGRMEARYYTESDDSYTYYITYSHDFREGYYERALSVSETAYNDFERGRPVKLIVDPQNPAVFDLPPNPFLLAEFSGPLLGLGCAAIWLVGSLWVAWLIFKANARSGRLWRRGSVVYGQVKSAIEYADSEGDKGWKMHYFFTSPISHKKITGDTLISHAKYLELVHCSDCTVAILFLADNHWALL